MDDKWFKIQQKKAGVTAGDIAEKMGRARSNVSHIYAGQQKMSLEWAQAFSEVLEVPLDEVLKHAGVLGAKAAQHVAPGFSESDAVPFVGQGGEAARIAQTADTLGGGSPGIDVWTVKSLAMVVGGYLPGDHILVDTHQSERCKPGDVVLAQNYNHQSGTAETILRRYEPPVLVSASTDPAHARALVVDFSNVVIRGKVIASWRK